MTIFKSKTEDFHPFKTQIYRMMKSIDGGREQLVESSPDLPAIKSKMRKLRDKFFAHKYEQSIMYYLYDADNNEVAWFCVHNKNSGGLD